MKQTNRGNVVELGSNFDLNLQDLKTTADSIFRYLGDLKYCLFDSGRSALRAVIPSLGSGCIMMPEYICQSVLSCFPADRIIFYRLKENLEIDTGDLRRKLRENKAVAAVFLMHYFGSLQPEPVLSLLRDEKKAYGFTIIEDTTHSLFSGKRTVGDCCVASLRKWFAVPGGGVLYGDSGFDPSAFEAVPRSTDNDRAYAMMLKHLHLRGCLDCNLEYRALFAACEKKLDRQEAFKRISGFSELLLGCYNVPEMVRRRKANWKRLKNELHRIGLQEACEFAGDDCPFAIPVLVPDRDDFRRYLMRGRIYCAVHWPFDAPARAQRPLAVKFSEHMLSLPVDQRYGEEEMAYLLDVMGAYKGRLMS